ncbi:MAG: type II secretion system protein [Phycisphaerae bacterium]
MRKLMHNKKPRTTRRGGFTLIELLVVISIIILLVTIIVPSIQNVIQTSYATKTQSFIVELNSGALNYSQQNNGYYPGQTVLGQIGSGGYTGSQVLAARLFGYELDDINNEDREPAGGYVTYRKDRLQDIDGKPGTIVDAWNIPEPIAYFPSHPGRQGTDQFKYGDNSAYFNSGDGSSGDFKSLISQQGFAGGNTPRMDGQFLLIAPGIDRKFFQGGDDLKNW